MKHKWHDEIVAWAGGAEIEIYMHDKWTDIDTPQWHQDNEYRIKPPPSREWQSLTHEEFVAIAKSIWGDNLGMSDGFGYTVAWASSYATIELSSKMLLLLQKIDKALREKNG